MNQVAALKPEAKQMMSYGILNPQNLDEALKMAEIMSRASIVPKDFQGNPGNIVVAMQWGMELGLAPLQAMQNIAVINGRPSLWGDAMIALVRGSAHCEYIKETLTGEGENMVATCYAKRTGQAEEVRTFSVSDARCAGLWDKAGPWKSYPKRMLQMRARGFAIRDVFADVLRGMACAEEEIDTAAERDITPPASQPRATELPSYLASDFENNLPTWSKLIASGKKTAEQIIATVESKGRLSNDQKAKLMDVKAAPVTVDAETGEEGVPQCSQEEFAAKLPEWTAVLQSGKRTAEQLIAIIETKCWMTEAQKTQLRGIK